MLLLYGLLVRTRLFFFFCLRLAPKNGFLIFSFSTHPLKSIACKTTSRSWMRRRCQMLIKRWTTFCTRKRWLAHVGFFFLGGHLLHFQQSARRVASNFVPPTPYQCAVARWPVPYIRYKTAEDMTAIIKQLASKIPLCLAYQCLIRG